MSSRTNSKQRREIDAVSSSVPPSAAATDDTSGSCQSISAVASRNPFTLALNDSSASAVPSIPLTSLGLLRRLPLPILRQRPAHIIGFLEPSLRTAPDISLVCSGVDRRSLRCFALCRFTLCHQNLQLLRP